MKLPHLPQHQLHLNRIVTLKLVLAIAMVASVVLPAHIAVWLGCCTNLVWLFKL